jgi:hypothetical protein
MIKLYKSLPDGKLTYHEAWITDAGILEHWGVIGSIGEHRTRAVEDRDAEVADLERVLAPVRAAGYAEIAAADHRVLVIEYTTEGEDHDSWRAKGEALAEELVQFLGWTGLGDCEGGNLEDDTLEVVCLVVDFAAAAAAIGEEFRDSEYGDYRRIHERG